MIEIGSLDRITAIFGERGVGKSTLAKFDAIEFQNRTGGFVIGHSPNGQIGAEPYIQFHDSLRSLEKGLRRDPALMHFIASGADPEDVLDFARRLSYSLREQAHKREGIKFRPTRPPPKGLMAAPVLVVIDEGTHTEQLKRKDLENPNTVRQQSELVKFLTSARHEHVAVTWLIQAPTSRSWVYPEQSNRFRVFRYMHEWGLNSIRAATRAPRDVLERIQVMPKFEYWHFDKDFPDKARFVRLPDP